MNAMGRMAWLAAGLLVAAASASGQVQVNSEETLTEADLLAGEFMGQPFTLGPGTVFEVNDGGVIGPVGTVPLEPDPPVPFGFAGSTVNLNEGSFFATTIGADSAVADLVLNVLTGGTVGDPAMQGLDGFFVVTTGGAVTVNGGSVALLRLLSDSTVDLLAGSIGSAVLGDGVVGEFSGGGVGAVVAEDGSAATLSGATISFGFRASGTGVVLMTAGSAGNNCMAEFGGTALIEGGIIGSGFVVRTGAHAAVSGGTVGVGFVVRDDSTAEITAGVVGDGFEIRNAAVVTLSDGSMGSSGFCGDAAVLNVNGGSIGANFQNGSVVNISGGSFGDGFNAGFFTTTHLFVLEASVDGVPLDLEVNETVVISERGGALLEATLADGSFIDFVLNFQGVSPLTPGVDWFDDFAFVQVTRVAGATPCAGDLNGDLVVDFNDITHALGNWLNPFDFNDITAVLGNWLQPCE